MNDSNMSMYSMIKKCLGIIQVHLKTLPQDAGTIAAVEQITICMEVIEKLIDSPHKSLVNEVMPKYPETARAYLHGLIDNENLKKLPDDITILNVVLEEALKQQTVQTSLFYLAAEYQHKYLSSIKQQA